MSMVGNGVIEVSAGTGEGVGGMVNGTGLKRPLDGQYFCTTLLCNNIEVALRRSIL